MRMRQEQNQTVSLDQGEGTDEAAVTGKSVRPSLIEVCGQARTLCSKNYYYSNRKN